MRAASPTKAGWRLNEWLRDVGFGRSKYYSLPLDLQPRCVKVGALRLIVEPPAEYLARLASNRSSEQGRAA